MYADIPVFRITIVVFSASLVLCQDKCYQSPPGAKVLTPKDPKEHVPYKLDIDTKGNESGKFLTDQTYIVKLKSTEDRHFIKFMITVEDPSVDENNLISSRRVDVGQLKTLDGDFQTTYSEICVNTVKNTDTAEKDEVTVHWISPKKSENNQRIRFLAMVAENDEVWFTGDIGKDNSLAITLVKNDAHDVDQPPLQPTEKCGLCSEARYEVIFEGMWSRGNHPLNFPEKPDDIAFEGMIGASHDFYFTLWEQGNVATDEVKAIFEGKGLDPIQKYIISNMGATNGTRTIIRGKRKEYPSISDPSQAIFRVDRYHHMFSIMVHMIPSPDWFLGTTKFELCSNDSWLEKADIPMYPFDAGVMDGISYTSTPAVTQPPDNIGRVGVGSFDKESPFYQMNLNDLKPFARMKVNRLDVYPLENSELCNQNGETDAPTIKEDEEKVDEDHGEVWNDEPRVAESRMSDKCFSQWSNWSPCAVSGPAAYCGLGTQMRARHEYDYDYRDWEMKRLGKCSEGSMLETRDCFIKC